ncbi:AIR synthase-related protein [Parapedobacter sp. 10938]|uniref:AIR synthase-related protein n=1 Tax=Parapedobacter flavus TaxID=3110225 RepID=UPI002DBDB928|nr:AIR synthase-related protein [Parapedobacter sp. 10938]MEC3880102.1 AIR synthase-related protein [Parapedobacter sp. 10938]
MTKQLGKIGIPLFDRTIATMGGHPRGEVRAGPSFGVDVSVVDLPGGLAMTMTSDPLSLIPSLGLEASAWLSVHLMANDMATTGQGPMYGQFVLNLPDTLSETDFKQYWKYIHRFCADIGVAITGGHTGFVAHQHSTIAGGGTLVTVAPRDALLTASAARAGDVILVTKHCALSSAAILAMSFPETVKQKAGAEIYRLACESFFRTSALPDALVAVNGQTADRPISAMHDVTEGGVLGAIYELAVASGHGVLIDSEKLPVHPVQLQVCTAFGLDPRYCVGAGAMVIACQPATARATIDRLRTAGIPCAEVGHLTDKANGIQLIEDGQATDMPYHDEDPYWAAFQHAYQNGWT